MQSSGQSFGRGSRGSEEVNFSAWIAEGSNGYTPVIYLKACLYMVRCESLAKSLVKLPLTTLAVLVCSLYYCRIPPCKL